MGDRWQREEGGDGVQGGGESGVYEHENEGFAVVETDAGVDPWTEWVRMYQWWSMFSTHLPHEEQWWVRYGLKT